MTKNKKNQSEKTEPVIFAQHVKKTYGGKTDKTLALRGVDLAVSQGEIVGILGPNGAGKTTLMEILQGLVKADSGHVEVFGELVRGPQTENETKRKIGISMQHSILPPLLTVKEVIDLQCGLFNNSLSFGDNLIEELVLSEKRSKKITSLSGGQKQRVAMIMALCGDPQLLFLDEPTSQLDPQVRLKVWDLIEKQRSTKDATVLITTHQMEEADRLCDTVIILDGGKILASGTPAELVEKFCPSKTLRLTFRQHVEIDFLSESDEVSIKPDKGNYRVTVRSDDIDQVFEKITQKLSIRNMILGEISVSPQTLEDVFIKLTGRGISN